ncbi:hypothetical protein [Sphingomonas sp. VNH70]|uniref:hypothetical protein n=1 Tax=Sphingomonas silueang TaxID=3156617 RepID=UPI0032B45538
MHAAMRSALFGSALPYAGWDLALGFRDSWYRSGGLVTRDVAALPSYAFTRAAAKWEDVGAGLQMIAAGQPAIIPGTGFIARPAYTNTVHNSVFAGAALNVSPTKMGTFGNGGQGGITRQILGRGQTADGLDYVDLRFSGTAAGQVAMYPVFSGAVPADYPVAAPGEFWSGAVTAQVTGATAAARISFTLSARNSDASIIYGTYSASVMVDGVIRPTQRYVVLSPALPANSATAQIFLSVIIPDGNTVDFTLRLWAPSLVKSPIIGPYVPTSTGPVTLAADDMRMTQPLPADEDSVLVVSAVAQTTVGALERPVNLVDDAGNNRISVGRNSDGTGSLSATVVVGGTTLGLPGGNVGQAGPGRYAIAVRRRAGRFSLAGRNSSGVVGIGAETAVMAMPVPTRYSIGSFPSVAGAPANGAIEFLGYRRGPATDDQVRAMLAAVSV